MRQVRKRVECDRNLAQTVCQSAAGFLEHGFFDHPQIEKSRRIACDQCLLVGIEPSRGKFGTHRAGQFQIDADRHVRDRTNHPVTAVRDGQVQVGKVRQIGLPGRPCGPHEWERGIRSNVTHGSTQQQVTGQRRGLCLRQIGLPGRPCGPHEWERGIRSNVTHGSTQQQVTGQRRGLCLWMADAR